MSIKYLVEGGAIGIRRVEKTDMKRLAKVTGATIQLTLANLEGEESFDKSNLGTADVVEEQRVGDNDFIFVRGCAAAKASTLLLRGSTEYMLEEAERSVHDALMAVSKTAESSSVVPGKRVGFREWGLGKGFFGGIEVLIFLGTWLLFCECYR